MKLKPIFAILIAVLLSMTGSLAAQSATNDTNNTAESRQEGMQDTGGDQEQRRTRSNAESWGPGRGLTLIGEVVSWNDESLQVKTSTGTKNVVLTPDTMKKADLRKGAQVAVDFVNSNNTGAIIATQVRPVSAADRDTHKGHTEMRSTSNGSSMNEDSDMVIVGTVTRFDDESVILSTADGDRTFVITPVTQRVFAYKVGDPVAIEYEIGPDRKMMAESIRQGTRDTGGDQEQRRTRASAESWGPGRGLTLVGEVVSENDEALQVRTTTGIENVVLTQGTRMQGDIDKGDRVAVDYVNDSSTGAIIAEQVRLTTEYSEQNDRGDNR